MNEKPKLIKDLGMRYPKTTSKRVARYGIYECPICKQNFETNTWRVNSGGCTKCISCSNRLKNTKHGYRHEKLYPIWKSQQYRCNNKNYSTYKYYGGRGITFSKIFEDFKEYLKYVESLENCYKKGFTLDRIDNNKGYEKGNLRWADKSTQGANRRSLTGSSSYVGVSKTKFGTYISYLNKNYKRIFTKTFKTEMEAVIFRERFIIENNLPHILNEIAI